MKLLLSQCRQTSDEKKDDVNQKWRSRKFKDRKVHAMKERRDDTSSSTDTDEFTETFNNVEVTQVSNKCLHAVSTRGDAFTTVDIRCPQMKHTKSLRLKIDTGAQDNALPIRTFKQMYGNTEPTKIITPIGQTTLTAYSGEIIKCIGSITLACRSGQSKWVNAIFYVLDAPCPVILGLATCEALKMVTINYKVETVMAATEKRSISSVKYLHKLYPGQFYTVGKFDEPAKIIIKPDAEPHIDRPRKCNINLKPKIEEELTKMVDMGIIRKVKEHTDWCSSIVYSTKKDGSLRICLDPKRLNEAIKRCPHKTPTLEEINPAFVGARWFSKLDAKSGY